MTTTEQLIEIAIAKLKTAIEDIELAEQFAASNQREQINSIRLSIEELTMFLTQLRG